MALFIAVAGLQINGAAGGAVLSVPLKTGAKTAISG